MLYDMTRCLLTKRRIRGFSALSWVVQTAGHKAILFVRANAEYHAPVPTVLDVSEGS